MKSCRLRAGSPSTGGARVDALVNRFLQVDSSSRDNRSVLCIGCRDRHELIAFQNAGFKQVVGIDLIAAGDDPIVQMDMHAMTFPENHFDVLFSCHSLEHAFDPGAALAEFARVLKHQAVCVIEVPIRFATTASDLQDFGSLGNLQSACKSFLGEILFAEEAADGRIARLAFVTRKNGDP